MKPALWFSRHDPTAAQLRDIENGYCCWLVAIPEGIRLGNQTINSVADRCEVLRALRELALREKAQAIFGVFPVPIQVELVIIELRKGALDCYSAWNVQRAAEGGRPTFEHRSFCFVGWFPLAREY